MSLGKIVVAGENSGGCAWVLDGGKAGVLADASSPRAMADALVRVYRNWSWARALAENGRRLALTRYAPGTVVAQYESACRQALDGWGTRSAAS